MESSRTVALVDRLSRFDRLVEIGIGTRTAVAEGLAERGCQVTATDVHEQTVPDSVSFVRDDVTEPDPTVYSDADAVYALRCPPELHRAVRRVGLEANATVLFTTLGGDPPAVPTDVETLPGTTLYRARTPRRDARRG